MNVLYGVLKEELERNLSNQSAYIEKLDSMEKGSIQYREIKGNTYVYLKFREGKRVISKYICSGKDINKVEELKKELLDYDRIISNLNALKEDEIKLRKTIDIYEK